MRLQVQYKSKPKKTDKQKKIDAEKKSNGPKLSSVYTDMSEYKNSNVDLDLTKMRYGIIDSCIVTHVTLNDGVLELKNSWIELLLIMIDTVISNNPDNFKQLLMENGVTNQFLCIETTYGKYPLEGNKYKAYNIFNSGYYLESTFTSNIILDAIVGLTRCIGIRFNEIKFHVVNKLDTEIENRFTTLEEYEYIVNISEQDKFIGDGLHIISASVMGEEVSIHRLDALLVAFCSLVYDKYGIVKVAFLPNNYSTGTITSEQYDETNNHMMRVRDSDVFIYTDGDEKGILQFIQNSLIVLEQNYDAVKIKVKSLRVTDKKHGYEIDEY